MHVFKHPKFYEEYRKRAKREQALERKRASERAGRVGPRAASRGASKQAIKRQTRTLASSVECGPNRWWRGKVFRGGRL